MTLNIAVVLTGVFAKERSEHQIFGTNHGDTLCGDCLRAVKVQAGVEAVMQKWEGFRVSRMGAPLTAGIIGWVYKAAEAVWENARSIEMD